MGKDAGRDGQAAFNKLDGHSENDLGEVRKASANERLKNVLNKPREKLEIEDEREQEKEVDKDGDIDRGPAHGM